MSKQERIDQERIDFEFCDIETEEQTLEEISTDKVKDILRNMPGQSIIQENAKDELSESGPVLKNEGDKESQQGIEAPSNLSFEEGIEQLEQLVKTLEQRDVPLENALKMFSQGIELVRNCNALLDNAQKKMQILLEGEDGQLYVENTIFPVKE